MPKSKFDFSSELAALTSDEFRPNIRLDEFLKEANGVAAFLRGHYKPAKGDDLPGLVDAGPSIKPALADEIEALVDDAYKATSEYRRTVDPAADATKIERASELVKEIHSVLEFYLDDGVDDEHDARFANVAGAHKDDPETGAALALALEEYADLAAMYQDDIVGIGGFDASLVTEAKKLSKELRSGSEPAAPTAASARALAKRNRILQLIDQRVRRVRAAAKFVYRKHPQVARETTSAYERSRRVVAKRSATRKKNAQPTNGEGKEPVTPNA
jgi:hypothetical protein